MPTVTWFSLSAGQRKSRLPRWIVMSKIIPPIPPEQIRGDEMTHEGERIDREVKRLERELETPISDKRRTEVQQAISHLKDKKRKWSRPH
jgi:hypothetical protein